MAVPKSKADEIGALVNAELHKPRSNDLALKRIEREIRALNASPDAEIRNAGLILAGALEALRFDIEGTRTRFEQALTATGHNSNVYVNFAVSLTALGLFREALEKIEMAVERSPEVGTLRLAVEFATHAFDLEKAERYADWLQRLNALEGDPDVTNALNSAAWQAHVLDTPGVNPSLLLARYEAARSVATSHKLRIPDERSTISMRGVLIEWAAYCPAQEIAEMNFEAAMAMAAVPSDPSELVVSFGYAEVASVSQQVA